MALVGEAHIIVRAITTNIDRDIQKGFSGVSSSGRGAGESLGEAFTRGFQTKGLNNVFAKVTNGIKTMVPGAEAARKAWANLARMGQFLGSAVTALVGGISAAISSIVALGGSAAGAISTLAILGNTVFALAAGFAAAKLALGGVGKAVTALNKPAKGGGGGNAAGNAARIAATKAIEAAEKSLALTIEKNREALIGANNDVRDAQLALNAAFAAGREEIQQLGFDAEDAALSEKRAGLALEKARLALAKAQDLPPNSRVRQEAELAYQEAELNLRKAKDRSADLNKEQDKLAKTGVRGTSVVIDATNALAKAEADRAKTVRDALRSEADANDNLADAKDKAAKAGAGGSGGGGGADPFAGLNQAQIDFAKFIAGLKPKFDELKRIAANSFLPPLQEAITTLMTKAFPVVAVGIGQVGAAMGEAAKSIANAITETKNLSSLSKLFTSSATIIETLGKALGSLFGAVLTILTVTAPIAERFFGFLADKFAQFDTYLKSVNGNKALVKFFGLAEGAMAQFGRIFGNIFGGIGAIITANLGPGTGGGYLLDWLETATQKFADLDSTTGKASGLKQFFLDASKNAQALFSAIGALVGELGKLGANPALAEAFGILGAGAPIVGQIAGSFASALPSAAAFLVAVLKVIQLLTDSSTTRVFFDVLTGVLNGIVDLLNSPFSTAIRDAIGPIQGLLLAFGGIAVAATFVAKILLGYVSLITGTIAGFISLQQRLILMTYSTNAASRAFGRLGAAILTAMRSPLGIVIIVIAALVGAFILLYKNSEDFRNKVNPILEKLAALFQTVFASVAAGATDVLPKVMEVITGIANALAPLIPIILGVIQQIIGAVAPLLPVLIQAGSEILAALMPLIPLLVNALVPAFMDIVKAIAPLIPLLLGALIPAFTSIISAIVPLVVLLVSSLVPVIGKLLSAIVPLVVTIIGALVPALVGIIEAVVPLITMLITKLVPVFVTIIEAILPLVVTIIETLVPVIVTLVEAFVPLITQIISAVVPVITMLIEALVPLITTIIDALVPVIGIVIEALAAIIPVIISLITGALDLLIPILKFLIGVFAALIPPIIAVVKVIIESLIKSITFIIDAVKNVIAFLPYLAAGFTSVFTGIQNFIKGVVNTIIGLIEGMVNGIITSINSITKGINDVGSAISGATGIKVPSLGKIPKVSLPRLAKGGTVFPSTGGSIVNVAEAGKPERIEPLDENGLSNRDKALIDFLSGGAGGGSTINVYAYEGQDVREIASEVDRLIAFRQRKGGAN